VQRLIRFHAPAEIVVSAESAFQGHPAHGLIVLLYGFNGGLLIGSLMGLFWHAVCHDGDVAARSIGCRGPSIEE
jgi:hypothetical protein